MKTILTIAGLLAVTASAFAQGQIVFQNNNATIGSGGAPFYSDVVGGTRISGTEARAALLAGPAASAITASLLPGSVRQGNLEMGTYTAAPFQTWVTFRTGTSTASGAGFVSVGNQVSRAFTTIGWSTAAIAQVAVWTGNYNTWSEAYAAALLPGSTVKIGVSNPINLTTAASGSATDQPRLIGLQSFAIAVVPVVDCS